MVNIELSQVKSLFDILNRPRFFLLDEPAITVSGHYMVLDLIARLRDVGNFWTDAFIVGTDPHDQNRLMGMVLLRPHLQLPGRYHYIRYLHARCGDSGAATLRTIDMLLLLSDWKSEEGLRLAVTGYRKLRISNLQATSPAQLPDHTGPSIEPIQ